LSKRLQTACKQHLLIFWQQVVSCRAEFKNGFFKNIFRSSNQSVWVDYCVVFQTRCIQRHFINMFCPSCKLLLKYRLKPWSTTQSIVWRQDVWNIYVTDFEAVSTWDKSRVHWTGSWVESDRKSVQSESDALNALTSEKLKSTKNRLVLFPWSSSQHFQNFYDWAEFSRPLWTRRKLQTTASESSEIQLFHQGLLPRSFCSTGAATWQWFDEPRTLGV